MRKSSLAIIGFAMLGAMVAFAPISSWAVDFTPNQIIYEPSPGLDPAALDASGEYTIVGGTLTIFLTNETSLTGGAPSTLLLTGIAFALEGTVSNFMLSEASVADGSTGWYNPPGNGTEALTGGDSLAGEWGGGTPAGPFVDIPLVLSTDYVASALEASGAVALDESLYLDNPVTLDGPEFGLLSGAFADAGGQNYVQDTIRLVFTYDGTLTGISNIVVSFGSPTAVPEPSTLLLLGSGLIGIAAFRRRKLRK